MSIPITYILYYNTTAQTQKKSNCAGKAEKDPSCQKHVPPAHISTLIFNFHYIADHVLCKLNWGNMFLNISSWLKPLSALLNCCTAHQTHKILYMIAKQKTRHVAFFSIFIIIKDNLEYHIINYSFNCFYHPIIYLKKTTEFRYTWPLSTLSDRILQAYYYNMNILYANDPIMIGYGRKHCVFIICTFQSHKTRLLPGITIACCHPLKCGL